METANDPLYDFVRFVVDVLYNIAYYTPRVLYWCWTYPKITMLLLGMFLLICFTMLLIIIKYLFKTVQEFKRITGI